MFKRFLKIFYYTIFSMVRLFLYNLNSFNKNSSYFDSSFNKQPYVNKFQYIHSLLKSSRYYKSLSSSRLMQRSTGMDLMKFRSTFENKFNPSRELDYFSNPKSSLFENVFGNAFVSPRTEHGKIPPWKYRDFWTGGHP